jgi:hypothetical protein
MADVSTNDVVKATVKMNLFNGQSAVQNVFQFRLNTSSVTDTGARADLVEKLETFYGELEVVLSEHLTFEEVDFFNLTTGQPMGATEFDVLATGANVGDVLPGGVAGLIVFRTGISRVLGRKYIGGFTEGNSSDGAVDSGALAALADAGGFMLGSFVGISTGGTWLPGVISTAGPFWAYQEAIIRNIWAYQRRRRPGAGI